MARFEIKHKLHKGQKFGKWKVIGISFNYRLLSPSKQLIRKVKVECQCGYECDRVVMDLVKGRTKMCVECSKKSKFRTSYKGVGELSGAHITRIKNGLVRRSKTLTFEVSKEYLWRIFLKQNKKCALSGVDIDLSKRTASLDRIDSSKSYIKGNVQWVHKVVNKMKMVLSQEEFINWCKLITNHNI